MPLPRVWKAMRWFAAHPPVPVLVRHYFGIKDPPPRSAAAAEPSSEAEILGLAQAFGMREG